MLFRASASTLAVAMGLYGAAGAAELDRAARVKELEARVAALETRQRAGSTETAAAVDAVLRDAERRSQLLTSGGELNAGYDDGFFIRSGAFELRPSVYTIFRHTTSWIDEPSDPADDKGFEDGFEYRRVELGFAGTVLSPQLAYEVVWKSPQGGEPALDEAFVIYSFADTPWSVKLGQFKDHVYQEEWVSSKRQLAAERSMLNDLLMGGQCDRIQGVALFYGASGNPLRADVAVHDGAGSQNTPFVDSPGESAAEEHFGVSGRVDWKLAGNWKDYKDFTARDTQTDLFVVGAGVDWTEGQFPDGVRDAVGGDRFFPALDAQWELAGPQIGLFAALVGDYTVFNDGGVDDDRLNWGTLIQAGWALTRQWEVFARYDLVKFDEDCVSEDAEDLFHEITAGINYYLGKGGQWGHRAKITVDVGYLPSGAPQPLRSIGVPAATDDDAVYIRAQLQLVI